jgi:hypothetical protein
MAGDGKTIKVCLTNRGNDSETPWAQDLGAAKGVKGARRVRLVNVPFMHAKPTWGDVVVVVPVADGLPTWDRDGVAWEQIGSRIAEDSGRWAMIVDYSPSKVTGEVAFRALVEACHGTDVVCEGAWAPSDGRAGRAYFAAPGGRTARDVMTALAKAKLPCTLAQIHPPASKPAAKPVAKAKAVAKAKGVAAKPEAAKPAAAKPAKVVTAKPSAAKPTAAKPAATKPSKKPLKAAPKRKTK